MTMTDGWMMKNHLLTPMRQNEWNNRTDDEFVLDRVEMASDPQQNDVAWQRHIDRLMKKLEEPSCSSKSPLQIEETQFDDGEGEEQDEERENRPPIIVSQTGKLPQHTFLLPAPPPPVPMTDHSLLPMSTQRINSTLRRSTQIPRTEDVAIQTDSNEKPSSVHSCCQDVSACPCVLVRSPHQRTSTQKRLSSRF